MCKPLLCMCVPVWMCVYAHCMCARDQNIIIQNGVNSAPVRMAVYVIKPLWLSRTRIVVTLSGKTIAFP